MNIFVLRNRFGNEYDGGGGGRGGQSLFIFYCSADDSLIYPNKAVRFSNQTVVYSNNPSGIFLIKKIITKIQF